MNSGVSGWRRLVGNFAISCLPALASVLLQKVHRRLIILESLFPLTIQYFLLVLVVVVAMPGCPDGCASLVINTDIQRSYGKRTACLESYNTRAGSTRTPTQVMPLTSTNGFNGLKSHLAILVSPTWDFLIQNSAFSTSSASGGSTETYCLLYPGVFCCRGCYRSG